MEIQKDFKELLELFHNNKVEYLVVGGYALALHGAPRFTGDIDIYVRPTVGNAEKIMKSIEDFGFASLDLTKEDFCVPEKVIQFGVPPVRIDIITSISGVSWEDAWNGKILGHYSDVSTYYLGLPEFIANKKAAGRKKDIADIEAIQENNNQSNE